MDFESRPLIASKMTWLKLNFELHTLSFFRSVFYSIKKNVKTLKRKDSLRLTL